MQFEQLSGEGSEQLSNGKQKDLKENDKRKKLATKWVKTSPRKLKGGKKRKEAEQEGTQVVIQEDGEEFVFKGAGR